VTYLAWLTVIPLGLFCCRYHPGFAPKYQRIILLLEKKLHIIIILLRQQRPDSNKEGGINKIAGTVQTKQETTKLNGFSE
jgi:hypothetical protein